MIGMRTLCLAIAATVAAAPTANAEKLDPQLRTKAGQAIDSAVAFLRAQQLEDGSLVQGDFGPAITGMIISGLLESDRLTVNDPLVSRGLAYLERHVQPDGGVYIEGSQKNYPTAVAILAFVAANKDGRYQKTIDRAVAFLKGEQWDESEGITPEDPKYGGAGYGRKSRPDLSNTAFMLEALSAAGLPKDDPAYRRAILFVSRSQNLTGEGANDLPQAAKGENDGGFYYTPAEDYNPGGHTEDGGLRSYASMTYAGLKSFVHAGVDKDDPRVKAAMEWIRNHYSLEENPGLGQQGLYYYYHTFAKALAVLEIDQFEDAKGDKHDWRADLINELVERQKPDGSWANENPRWLEDDSRLATAYVLMALARVLEVAD